MFLIFPFLKTLIITGIEGGTFNLIVQDLIPTSDLTTASSNSDIANALYYAAAQITSTFRECLYFTVTKTLNNNGKTIQIKVQFQTDNKVPLTFVSVFLGNTLGKYFHFLSFFLCQQYSFSLRFLFDL